MRSNRLSPQQQEAVSRRLALLSAELAAVREPRDVDESADWAPPDTHTRIAAHRWPGEQPSGSPSGGLGDEWAGSTPTPTWARGERTGTAAAVGRSPVGQVGPVPVPGRHARSRGGLGASGQGWLRGLADPGLGERSRLALGPAQLAVVALVVLVGLAVTAWALLRSSPTEVAEPPLTVPGAAATPLFPSVSTSPSPVGAVSGGGAAPTEVVVDVAGRVRRPGIAVLEPGSRVVDALEAAGGVRAGVDLSGINLARPLVDGEQILVGVPAAAGIAAGSVATAAPAAGAGPLVPLNTAVQAELEALPEVGPVTAQAIIAWREAHGGFTAVDELLEVDGIGEATLGQIAPLVTL